MTEVESSFTVLTGNKFGFLLDDVEDPDEVLRAAMEEKNEKAKQKKKARPEKAALPAKPEEPKQTTKPDAALPDQSGAKKPRRERAGQQDARPPQMPKSKRDRPVPLTKTKKRRGQDVKSQLMQRVRELVSSHDRILVLCIDNMRSSKLQMLRAELKDSKLLLGKNRLIAKALGLAPEDELQPNLHRLSRLLRCQKALLFTNRSLAAVSEVLAGLTDADYARSGFTAVNSVELMPGACPQWQHSMEPALRKLGLPVRLVKGIVHLERPHLVCRRGRRLTPEQCEVLKLCQYQMAEFRARPAACWDKSAGGRLTDNLLSEAAAPAAASTGRVRLTSTVLDDGLSYFVPELLDEDPDDGQGSEDDAEMASGDEESTADEADFE